MMFSKFPKRPLALTLALLPTTSLAHEADRQCAVVVSSWRTLQKAQEFRAAYPELKVERIYKSYDGWYSVAIDLVPHRDAPDVLQSLKSSSAIPPDSFCLKYAPYIDTAWEATTPVAEQVATATPAPTPAARPEIILDAEVETTPTTEPASTPVAAEVVVEEAAPEIVTEEPASEPLLAEVVDGEIFDAGTLSFDDVLVLQTGLAYLGHYEGALDGVWGKGTQAAFDSYARTDLQTAPTTQAAVELLSATMRTWHTEDWRLLDLPDFDVSLHIPSRLIEAIDQMDGSLNLVSKDGMMTGRIIANSFYITEGLHETVLAYHGFDSKPELVREDGLLVTAARDDVSRIYMRSYWSDTLEQWVSLIITHPIAQPKIANHMIATFKQGGGTNLFMPESSKLFEMARAQGHDLNFDSVAVAANDDAEPSSMARPVSAQPTGPVTTILSKSAPLPHGSGFYINAGGDVMTSHFVANECQSLKIDGEPGLLLAASEEFDLAIIRKADGGKVDHFLSFAPQSADVEQFVTVSGYHAPSGEKASLTNGVVYASLGRDDSWSEMQIASTSQISPGGPIVDHNGNVVGVVSTLFQAGTDQDALGTTHAISYAVRGELGTVLAQLSGVDVTKAGGEAAGGTHHPDAATVSITCGQAPSS